MTEERFNQLSQTYLDMIYRIALNWFGNPYDAEDVTQEVMLRLWQRAPDLPEADLRYWLVRVTINRCKDLTRALKRRPVMSLDELRPLATAEQVSLLPEVLLLPRKYRVPLYLYYYEGYSVKELAKLLQTNPSTIQTRLSRGRDRLKAQLKEV